MEHVFTDAELVPERGDFSIILNSFFKKSLTFDFHFVEHNKLWNIFDNYLSYDDNHPLKLFLKDNCYKFHNDDSFENNMFYLEYIYLNGWTEFVIQVLNLNHLKK